MKQLPVKVGKTYWGLYFDGLKQCTVLELLPNDYCHIRIRYGKGKVRSHTWYTSLLRAPSAYVYVSEKAARKALVRRLIKEADKKFGEWNGLATKVRKAKEALAKL